MNQESLQIYYLTGEIAGFKTNLAVGNNAAFSQASSCPRARLGMSQECSEVVYSQLKYN